jgi:hypothetical protein
MMLKVAVPANGAALVKLPDARIEAVTESGVALADAPGCANPRQEAGCVVIEVGAGEYTFQW